ncbi:MULTISPECIES: hypothetical protein [Staphylococcus]|jgi:hypothetical protein|uniref:Uncharacterized protein n=1 Tax=Staphylococcus nepalensis TaxID=214473 RepID=A0A291JMX5_9STAP|nr:MULTISPECIES: hypothetical protein [Staphylococcus]VDG67751.1 Uncharacterised protein [Lacrimispora indolis]ATH60788.1 hypothetical protein BJD96_10995 [Staphylococcus nepalensis]ATH65818.1 hypothetical protein BJG89_11005 [Staphylococcus nepalensis]AWI45208.1 hypothetical protein BJG88_10885 [Staphylococcus nepalensis]MBO1206640.1 hypothetical protein [Staphylococcus nepalensis]
MNKQDLFNNINQDHQSKPKGLRHMMTENDYDDSKLQIRARYKFFILTVFLLFIAFGIIKLFIL